MEYEKKAQINGIKELSIDETESLQEQLKDEYFMGMAIEQARKAAALGEVPVGAVVVLKEEVIGSGYNRVEIDNNPLRHAELIAIEQAASKIDAWRLLDSTLYVTLEPCAMCAGAMVHSRIKRVVYAASDYKRGCGGTALNLLEYPVFNHTCEVKKGVRAEECSKILSEFFAGLREKNTNALKGNN